MSQLRIKERGRAPHSLRAASLDPFLTLEIVFLNFYSEIKGCILDVGRMPMRLLPHSAQGRVSIWTPFLACSD